LNLLCTSDCAGAKKRKVHDLFPHFQKGLFPVAITPTTPHLDWTGHGTFSMISFIKVRRESSKEMKAFERKRELIDD
jgi:hypothetical protein